MTKQQGLKHLFGEGDHALLIDRRRRRYLVELRSSESFQSHIGNLNHDDLIGSEEGTWFVTSLGHNLLALKPTMSDFTRLMPRIATVVYPKDMGAILIHGDVFEGARVLEAGTGSGAMTIALLRAVGKHGQVVSYDVRPDMIKRAQTNVHAMFPSHPNLHFKIGDVYLGFDDDNLDRIILDLPEPWKVVPHASEKLAPGGIFLSFLPTILQVHELCQTLMRQKTFTLVETIEVLVRQWSVEGRSVRPSQRMIGHTGFITTARKCTPRLPPSTDKTV